MSDPDMVIVNLNLVTQLCLKVDLLALYLCILSSMCVSTALVASSNTRIVGFLKIHAAAVMPLIMVETFVTKDDFWYHEN